MSILKHNEIADRTPVDALAFMSRGGDWLGSVRNFIQCKAPNGEHVTWGSSDHVTLNVSVLDLEHLAARIAAHAVRDARADIDSFLETLRPSGIHTAGAFGQRTMIYVEPHFQKDPTKLNHDHCVGAYSWFAGKMVFGQGKFTTAGVWEHKCATCTAHRQEEI